MYLFKKFTTHLPFKRYPTDDEHESSAQQVAIIFVVLFLSITPPALSYGLNVLGDSSIPERVNGILQEDFTNDHASCSHREVKVGVDIRSWKICLNSPQGIRKGSYIEGFKRKGILGLSFYESRDAGK